AEQAYAWYSVIAERISLRHRELARNLTVDQRLGAEQMAKSSVRKKAPADIKKEATTRAALRRVAGGHSGSLTSFLVVFSLSVWKAAIVIQGLCETDSLICTLAGSGVI